MLFKFKLKFISIIGLALLMALLTVACSSPESAVQPDQESPEEDIIEETVPEDEEVVEDDQFVVDNTPYQTFLNARDNKVPIVLEFYTDT